MAEHHVPVRLLADLVRVGAVLGAVAALFGIPSFGAGARSLLVLLVLVVPLATGRVPAPLDLTLGVTLLAALWASTASWYDTGPVVWVAHAVTTGVTAAVMYVVLARDVLRATDGRSCVVLATVLIGLVVGGGWEAYRWFESMALPVSAQTMTNLPLHLLVDAAGALVAGLVLAAARDRSRGPAVPTLGPRARGATAAASDTGWPPGGGVPLR